MAQVAIADKHRIKYNGKYLTNEDLKDVDKDTLQHFIEIGSVVVVEDVASLPDPPVQVEEEPTPDPLPEPEPEDSGE